MGTLWAHMGDIGGCIGLICSKGAYIICIAVTLPTTNLAMQNYCHNYDETKHKMITVWQTHEHCIFRTIPSPHNIYTIIFPAAEPILPLCHSSGMNTFMVITGKQCQLSSLHNHYGIA